MLALRLPPCHVRILAMQAWLSKKGEGGRANGTITSEGSCEKDDLLLVSGSIHSDHGPGHCISWSGASGGEKH